MDLDENRDIARHAVSGSAYSVLASAVTLSLGFVRATVMARLLLPEHFGVAALALFYLNLAAQLRALGIDSALVHRKKIDDKVLGTYFTLRLGLIAVSLALLAIVAPFLGRLYPEMPMLTVVLFGFMGISIFKGLNSVQMTVLSKNLAFRHLASTDVLSSITMTIVGPLMAWQGFGVWSIVGEQFSGVFVRSIAIWLFYRVWRPRLGWDREIAVWFWNYGIKMWFSGNLGFLLDRFDDWWTGTYLGGSPLGFYSRAYEFAGYPRRVIANPLLSVFFPTFARLQEDRQRLSRAFFRMTSLMIRVGVLFTLVFVFTAPEFIVIFLGEKWMPMLVTFQLMIIYTLLDPLSTAAENLLAATGYPGIIARTRLVQVIAFIPAVALLGLSMGIEGVAVAADLMILIGAIFLFHYTKLVVDYSDRALWFWPAVGLLAVAAVLLGLQPFWSSLPLWGALLGKAGTATALYLLILWIVERRQLRLGWRMIWSLVRPMVRTG